MKEIVLTGKHYRVMGSVLKKVWYRVSWWTAAKDVEFKDGTTLEDKYHEYTAAIGVSNWTAVTDTSDPDKSYYKYEMPVAKVADKHPYISLIPNNSNEPFPSAEELEQYSYITAVEVKHNALVFYAIQKPTMRLVFEIRGVVGV